MLVLQHCCYYDKWGIKSWGSVWTQWLWWVLSVAGVIPIKWSVTCDNIRHWGSLRLLGRARGGNIRNLTFGNYVKLTFCLWNLFHVQKSVYDLFYLSSNFIRSDEPWEDPTGWHLWDTSCFGMWVEEDRSVSLEITLGCELDHAWHFPHFIQEKCWIAVTFSFRWHFHFFYCASQMKWET